MCKSQDFGVSPPHPLPDQIVMPDVLDFFDYKVHYPDNGLPPMHPKLEPNIAKGLSACLYMQKKTDQYARDKFYVTCTGTRIHNVRSYPPLYPGDVFPVLDQLYYFDGERAIKVQRFKTEKRDHSDDISISQNQIEREGTLTEGKIIIPLTPFDLFLLPAPYMLCRCSSVLEYGTLSLIWIGKTKQDKPLASIHSEHNGQGGGIAVSPDSFRTKKTYETGDIIVCYDYLPYRGYADMNKPPAKPTGFRLTKIVPPDPDRNRVFVTAEGEKKGRLIGWVELDPTPIPIDENGNPIEDKE